MTYLAGMCTQNLQKKEKPSRGGVKSDLRHFVSDPDESQEFPMSSRQGNMWGKIKKTKILLVVGEKANCFAFSPVQSPD